MTVAANGLGRLLGGRRRWPRWFLLALLCRGQARGGWRPRAQPFLGVGAGGDGWGPAMSEVTRSLLQRWGASFRRGADFDSWGQLVEAIDEYQMWVTNCGSGPDGFQSAAFPFLSVGVSHHCICSQGFSGWGPAGTGAETSLAPETTVRSLGFFALRRASSVQQVALLSRGASPFRLLLSSLPPSPGSPAPQFPFRLSHVAAPQFLF